MTSLPTPPEHLITSTNIYTPLVVWSYPALPLPAQVSWSPFDHAGQAKWGLLTVVKSETWLQGHDTTQDGPKSATTPLRLATGPQLHPDWLQR